MIVRRLVSREQTGSIKNWFKVPKDTSEDWKHQYRQLPMRKVTIKPPYYMEEGEEFMLGQKHFIVKTNQTSVQICPDCRYEYTKSIVEIPSTSSLYDVVVSVGLYHFLIDFYCSRCNPI